eukprot:5901790-Prymnesium_polylepis.1
MPSHPRLCLVARAGPAGRKRAPPRQLTQHYLRQRFSSIVQLPEPSDSSSSDSSSSRLCFHIQLQRPFGGFDKRSFIKTMQRFTCKLQHLSNMTG